MNQYESRTNHLKENKTNNCILKQNIDDIKKFYKFLGHKTKTNFQVFGAMTHIKSSTKPSSPSKQSFVSNNDIETLLKLCNSNKLKGVICLGINERPKEQKNITDKLPKINVILFDIDVRKAKKINGISPLNLKKESKEVMERCKTKLEEFGFVVDLTIDSGNGYHIYIKVDLNIPNYTTKEEFEELPIYKRLVYLETQLREFNTKNVEIDFLSKDIIRRVKIPGTYNVKRYKDIDGKFKLMPKEQWRIAKILYLNENINEERNNKTFMNLPLDCEVTVKKKNITGMFEPKKSLDPDLTTIRLKDFNNLLKKDEKLKKLYNGELTKQFKSRSEAELSLIIKLMYYKVHDSHIREIMKTCEIGKWKETSDAYKITTMKKARDWVKTHPKSKFDITSILQEAKNIPKNTTNNNLIFKILNKIPILETGAINKIISVLSEQLENYGKIDLKNFVKKIKIGKSEIEEGVQIERIVSDYILKQNIIFTLRETDELCLFKNGRFIHGTKARTILRTQITDITKKIDYYDESKAKRSMIFEFIKTQSFCSVNDFDCNYYITNLKNGLYDFENYQFTLHDSNNKNPYKSFIQLPIEYNSKEKCPTIERFLGDVFGDERVSLIYEWFAYLIMNTVKYHKALMLYGPTDTGETTFLQLIFAFLGWKHISGISLQDLWKRFQITNLRDRLANIHDDLDSKTITYIGTFKKIVTNMYLTGEAKNVQDYIDWLNRTKLMFACNRLPKPKEVGDDFWRRWILLSCFNQFIKGVNRDVDMLIKITTPKELSGLFNKVIEGRKRLEERGGFPKEWANIDYVKNIWLMDINPVKGFVNKYCDTGNSEYEVDYELFYKILCKYRKNHQVKEISKNICTRSLGKIDERIKKKQVSKEYHPKTSGFKYVYIKFKEDALKKLKNKKKKKKETIFIEAFPEENIFIEFTPEQNDLFRAKILDFFYENKNKLCFKNSIIQVLTLDYEKEEKIITQIFDNMVKENIIEKTHKGYNLNSNFYE